jgi:hypothetical protein
MRSRNEFSERFLFFPNAAIIHGTICHATTIDAIPADESTNDESIRAANVWWLASSIRPVYASDSSRFGIPGYCN